MNAPVASIGTARVVPLTEAVELNPRPDRSALPDDLEVSFVPMAAVEAGTGRMDATTVRPFGEVKKGYAVFRERDVLFAKITPCMENGKMAVVGSLHNGVGCGSTEFHVLRPRPGVDPHYVYYFVSGGRFRAGAAHHMTGAVGQKRVPASYLKQCEIPLPDLDGQRCIVAEIEKQFSRLDEGAGNLKRIAANLKRYWAAVLNDAVHGRLVPTEADLARRERRSYESGDRVLERFLEERRSRQTGKTKYREPAVPNVKGLPHLPEGWAWASLEQLSWEAGYGTSVKCSYDDEGPAVLRIPNVENASLDVTDLKFGPTSLAVNAADAVSAGDMLVIRTNGSKPLIGQAAVIRAVPPLRMTFASYLIRFRLVEADVLAAWLSTVWQSSRIRTWIESNAATSAGQYNISMSVLATAAIPLPPIAEQQRITAEIDRRLSLVRELESQLHINSRRADRLRESVLAIAFSGNVP